MPRARHPVPRRRHDDRQAPRRSALAVDADRRPAAAARPAEDRALRLDLEARRRVVDPRDGVAARPASSGAPGPRGRPGPAPPRPRRARRTSSMRSARPSRASPRRPGRVHRSRRRPAAGAACRRCRGAGGRRGRVVRRAGTPCAAGCPCPRGSPAAASRAWRRGPRQSERVARVLADGVGGDRRAPGARRSGRPWRSGRRRRRTRRAAPPRSPGRTRPRPTPYRGHGRRPRSAG